MMVKTTSKSYSLNIRQSKSFKDFKSNQLRVALTEIWDQANHRIHKILKVISSPIQRVN